MLVQVKKFRLSFLADIRQRFISMFPTVKSPYGELTLDPEFAPVLRNLIQAFSGKSKDITSSGGAAGRQNIDRVQEEIQGVQVLMKKNIEKVSLCCCRLLSVFFCPNACNRFSR